MARFNPFYSVPCRFGAPMGRRSYWRDTEHWIDEKVKLCATNQGGGDGYDRGGAYWGIPGNVWAVWQHGKGEEAVVYVRAQSREEAIRKARMGEA